MKAGPELDERVGRLLGWEPEITAAIAVPANIGRIECWPAVSTDGNVMLRAIDAMRERGWDGFKVETMGDMSLNRDYWQKEGLWYCWFSGERGIKMKGGFHGETTAHAVALAICAALESEASRESA